MNILIAYATTEGQTQKIAGWIGDWLRKRGHEVSVLEAALAGRGNQIDGYDAYILAGSLHQEKHQKELVEFAKRHVATLQKSHSAFLSVSASASRTDEGSQAATRRCIGTFIQQTSWIPRAWLPVGGAIKYTKYNFILRAVMKSISKKNNGPTDTSKDHELTDWEALEKFVDRFINDLLEAPVHDNPVLLR